MTTYQIGNLAEGVGALQDATTLFGIDPQPTDFLEYSEVVGNTLSGRPIESGFPMVTWRWAMMYQRDFNVLFAFCTGAATEVLIRTRVNSGTFYQFGIFRATMTRPKGKTTPGNLRQDVEVLFTMLQSP